MWIKRNMSYVVLRIVYWSRNELKKYNSFIKKFNDLNFID